MKQVDWSVKKSKPSNGNGGGISFLKFEKDRTYRVRPLGNAIEFYKIFVAKGKPSLAVDSTNKDQAAKMISEAAGHEVKANYRNAMFVINREDGRIQVLEAGYQVFEQLSNWSTASGIDPGAGKAGDWTITVTGDGVGGSNPRKYVCSFMGAVPFSEAEKTTISKLKNDGQLKLANYIKEVPLDKVLEVAGYASPAAAVVESGVTVSSDDGFDF